MTCMHLLQGRGLGLLLSALLLLGDPAVAGAQDKVGNGSLIISDGRWDSVYALQLRPKTGNALAESARLVINGGSVSSSIYGGYARSDKSTARAGSNNVIISGGLTGNSPGIYGGYARSSASAIAAANSLSIRGSLALGDMASAYGGYARADGGDGGLFMTSNNRVAIGGTSQLMQAFGGRTSAINGGSDTVAAAYGNMVSVAGGRVDELYGGSATGKGTAEASGNTVTISGGTVGHAVGGQAFSTSREAVANDNVISVTGGRITENLIAASVQSDAAGASASNNAVYLRDTVVEQNVTGGFAPDNTLPVSLNGNSIVVGAGATVQGAVHGGDAAGTAGGNSASYNTISVVEGGRVDGDLVGGNLEKSAGEASHNTVLVNNGSVSGDIYGGRTAAGGSATGNSIIIGRQAKLPATQRSTVAAKWAVPPSLPAAAATPSLWTAGKGRWSARRALPTCTSSCPRRGQRRRGVPMLTISNAGAEDFDGTTVTAQLPDIITGGRAHLGETFELLHDGSGAIAKADTGSLISLLQGYAVLYDGAIFSSSDSIYIRIDGTRPNPLAGALTEARIGAAGLLNQGGDLVAGAAMREARAAARQTEGTGWAAFATIYGGTASLTTETDVTTRGLSLVTGLARHAETAWVDVLLGAFFEAGYGSLATSREVTGTTVWGSGDAHYTGGGLLARIDLTRGLLRGLYAEGSGRAGEVATSWNSDDLLDNLDRPADYDLSTPYYGGHAGLGYRLPLGETWTLDVYGKYLFTHQNGQETGLHGDSIHFDAVDSSRLRLGARLDGNILPAASVYMGAAWEYEYLGTARAASRTSDMSIPSTTMTGSSALFELGLAVTPETAPLRLDLALEGAAGTRRSIGGRVQLVYEF